MEQITPPATVPSRRLRINLIDLGSLIITDIRRTLLWAFIAAVIGVIVAFSIPRIYKSSVSLAPEEMQSSLGSGVSSLASMVGLDMHIGTSDAIYPEIYPEIMHSPEFIVGLFSIPVATTDGAVKTDYRTYLARHQRTAWWTWPKAWAVRQIRQLKGESAKAANAPVDPARLTRDEDALVRGIDNLIRCDVDKKTNVITLTVTAQDPLVAKTLVDSTMAHLQDYITNYRTSKARADLAYIEQIYDKARVQYETARARHAAAADTRRDVVMESSRSVLRDLENDMQLKYGIFTQVAEQRQLAEANVQKMTPAFTVIKSATVPVRHANRPKVLILAFFTFLGVLARTAVLIVRHRERFLLPA